MVQAERMGSEASLNDVILWKLGGCAQVQAERMGSGAS